MLENPFAPLADHLRREGGVSDTPDQPGVRTPQPPTTAQYAAFQFIYDFQNTRLFNGRLPPVLITMQRQRETTLGYFCANRFISLNGNGERVHELALNPATFTHRGFRGVASTIAHEQAHAEEQHFGKPPRRGYHSRPWANRMKQIGLQPVGSDGRETGYHLDHTIIEGGLFAVAFEELEQTTEIAWGDALSVTSNGSAPRAKPKRLSFACPLCQNVKFQAVPSMAGKLACVPCGFVLMTASNAETEG
jgi:hypothetical protein